MADTILIVEDDENIAKLIDYNLVRAGFSCIITSTGEEALTILDKESVNLIILDIMLPQMDGFQTCKLIKQHSQLAHIPIVMLTAKGQEIDRVVGFELGADDYVVKPFSTRELVLRVKAILDRTKPRQTADDILKVDKLTVDTARHRVIVGAKEIELTAMEFKLLVTLMRRKGRVQSRDKLLDDVWDIASEVTTRTVDTHIKRLRQKLGKAAQYIETVRGVGYRFSDED